MQRIVVNQGGMLSYTFDVPEEATVEVGDLIITDSTGDILSSQSADEGADPHTATFALNSGDAGTLDTLTLEWQATVDGDLRSFFDVAEIVGGFVFTDGQAQAAGIEDVNGARLYAEQELESALGYALVPRYHSETVYATDRLAIRTTWPRVRTIRSITAGDIVWDEAQIARIQIRPWSLRSCYWYPTGPITIGYEHGLDRPPAGAIRAALALAQDTGGGGAGGIDPRAESIITVDGTVRLRSATGQFSAIGVNEWISANRLPNVA